MLRRAEVAASTERKTKQTQCGQNVQILNIKPVGASRTSRL
jgi:hypothetical protein